MEKLSQEFVFKSLRTVLNPMTGYDIVSEEMVKTVTITETNLVVILEINSSQIIQMEKVKLQIERLIDKFRGSRTCQVILTAHTSAEPTDKSSKGPPPILKEPTNPIKKRKPKAENLNPDGVKKIIAIASGKGGVGKSTVAANLATALAVKGKRIGLLDADVYGPSQPRMFGLSDRPSSPDGKIILPLQKHGVTLMSLGLMVPENEAIVWRGPMLMGALQQMLRQVQWGILDLLIVDLPPGTGDVQLTLSQKTNLSGAVIVSTPQDIALLDARKGIDMFKKLNVSILGLIENMSSFTCTGCGMTHHPFSSGTLKVEAKKLRTKILADLPLDLETRIASDQGIPIVIKKPKSTSAAAFLKLADELIETELFE